MTITRDNHYVPEWYQRNFFDERGEKLAYLNMTPSAHLLPNGEKILGKSLFSSYPKQCFKQRDLYTTYLGTEASDEVEARLFGKIDTTGSQALRAFTGSDAADRHRHFEEFFVYMDAQKLRTPKGLDWLLGKYEKLDQNNLMRELQAIRLINLSVWLGSVREIVSALDSQVKFIISDHPVTIYNYAAEPASRICQYPDDPPIAAMASQTIFPLDRENCLILTNLEYAQNQELGNPLQRRTFARNYHEFYVRTDALLRSRRLNSFQVTQINFIIKQRARQFIAAGRPEWLYPERTYAGRWQDLRAVLAPPEGATWEFGGEMYAGHEDGSVSFQDQFGRKRRPPEFLSKPDVDRERRRNEHCGCGSGRRYRHCCMSKPEALRPTWRQLSIRERNIALANAIVDILKVNDQRTWVEVRRDMDDVKIQKLFGIFAELWPLETEIVDLLPKPDGVARAVFTGLIDPRMIPTYVTGAGLYFDEILVQSPFIHPGTLKEEFSPLRHPELYRHSILKAVLIHMQLMPLIEEGIVNMFPDPMFFDRHLLREAFYVADERSQITGRSSEQDPRIASLFEEDNRAAIMSLPPDVLRSICRKTGASDQLVDAAIDHARAVREQNPLASLQEADGDKSGGSLMNMMLAPNFEMTLYLAQVAGAFILTDSPDRWREIQIAISGRGGAGELPWEEMMARVRRTEFCFPTDAATVIDWRDRRILESYRQVFRDLYNYASAPRAQDWREGRVRQVVKRFEAARSDAAKQIGKLDAPFTMRRMECVIPNGGIRHNNVNRLMLMTGVERYRESVPLALLIQ